MWKITTILAIVRNPCKPSVDACMIEYSEHQLTFISFSQNELFTLIHHNAIHRFACMPALRMEVTQWRSTCVDSSNTCHYFVSMGIGSKMETIRRLRNGKIHLEKAEHLLSIHANIVFPFLENENQRCFMHFPNSLSSSLLLHDSQPATRF